MKKFIEEFKEFAITGSAFDLAVGVVIGGAFGAIIGSFVDNIINPIISLVLPASTLDTWVIQLRGGANPVDLQIGAFLQTVLVFLITAFVLFLMVKAINALRARTQAKKKEEVVEEVVTKEEALLAEILEQLKKQ